MCHENRHGYTFEPFHHFRISTDKFVADEQWLETELELCQSDNERLRHETSRMFSRMRIEEMETGNDRSRRGIGETKPPTSRMQIEKSEFKCGQIDPVER
ncbi:hypothetical protein AVEN_194655-1 [Araneus ventricosus]|uniref:Uncharacterized protein n=1 Tax=Araneus ventricosus TaxID=182803 RepID=A0A4Y2A6N7_ARAVE|nr:hypothetical protein AVEN_194655-1 [Araneus ventricosus]